MTAAIHQLHLLPAGLSAELRHRRRLRLWLDINETLIRTGELSPDDRLREAVDLNEFVGRCQALAKSLDAFNVVFVTGNSFEYARRVEEPLGLKNLAGVQTTIVSENGLVGRSFATGDAWKAQPKSDYWDAVENFYRDIEANVVLKSRYYSQGNEVRSTLKPVANRFTQKELDALSTAAQRAGLDTVARLFLHDFYVDIDPKRVTVDSVEVDFPGKGWAVHRLAQQSDHVEVAIGDSSSDVPMFEAVRSLGGVSFVVGNAGPATPPEAATRLATTFTDGVNTVLEVIEKALSR